MILCHIEERKSQFGVVHCDDLIHVWLKIREELVARRLDSGTVRDRVDLGDGGYLTGL